MNKYVYVPSMKVILIDTVAIYLRKDLLRSTLTTLDLYMLGIEYNEFIKTITDHGAWYHLNRTGQNKRSIYGSYDSTTLPTSNNTILRITQL